MHRLRSSTNAADSYLEPPGKIENPAGPWIGRVSAPTTRVRLPETPKKTSRHFNLSSTGYRMRNVLRGASKDRRTNAHQWHDEIVPPKTVDLAVHKFPTSSVAVPRQAPTEIPPVCPVYKGILEEWSKGAIMALDVSLPPGS